LTARELLDHARAVLGARQQELVGVWPRAVALLARQALELAIAESLARRAPGAERVSARARLICLPTYVSNAVAHDANYLWGTLSRACHQHPYELAPTVDELARWIEGVERVSSRLTDVPKQSSSAS
jgi:cytochrome c5